MKKVAYVIVPINYEYNDERDEEKGLAEPRAIYLDKELAKQTCDIMNAEAIIKSGGLSNYSYDAGSLQEAVEEVIPERTKGDIYDDTFLPIDLTLDEAIQVYKVIKHEISFFKLFEVPIED